MGWLKRLLLSRFVKSALDKLPLDGYKSTLSLLLFALSMAAATFCGSDSASGPVCAGIALADQILRELGIESVTSTVAEASLGALIIGLYHKLLKRVYSTTEDELPPAKE